jgi:hypothetical protein
MSGDVFIGLDQANYFNRFLYGYSGNLYQLIPIVDTFRAPLSIRMWKSTNSGASWSLLSSSIALQNGTGGTANQAGASPCLLGTKLYISCYAPATLPSPPGVPGQINIACFDFTTDTFSIVTTTSNPISAPSRLTAGSDANHLFLVYSGGTGLKSVVIGEYVSNAFSVLGTLAPNSPYTNSQPQQAICGSSGILHVLYEATQQSSAIGPSDLGYVNVVSGSIGGTIGSNIVYTNYSDSFLVPDTGTGLAPPLQVGSTIYVSFYDPVNQKVRLLKFGDVAGPTFSVSDIDPSWTISGGSASNEPGEGSWSNVLAYYNSTLFCFYVNTWKTSGGVFSGDSTLYYRTSADGGATWSARTVVIVHDDPHDGTPFVIWYPQAVVFAGTVPSPVTSVELSYNQAKANSQGNFGFNGRFSYAFAIAVAESARNYVLS